MDCYDKLIRTIIQVGLNPRSLFMPIDMRLRKSSIKFLSYPVFAIHVSLFCSASLSLSLSIWANQKLFK